MANRKSVAAKLETVSEAGIVKEDEQFEDMSVAELNSLIERVTAARDGKIEASRKSFIERTRAEAEQLGLALEDLMPQQPAKREAGKRGPAPVKYRGPNGETWSGRGRSPSWLAAFEAEGRNKEEFLVT